jgi:hypothetical protein
MVNWLMKTTLELPDDLIRRVKIHAIHEKRKLKDAVAILLEQGMAHTSSGTFRSLAKPVVLKRRRSLTSKDIEKAIASGRT